MDLNKENMAKIKNLILFTVVMVILGVNYQKILILIGDIMGIISPFLTGAAVAFVLNVPMRSIEKHIMASRESKLKRPISLCLTLILVVGILGVVTFVVVPELIRTVMTLQSSIPAFLNESRRQAEEWFVQYPQIVDYINAIQVDWKQVAEDVIGFLSNGAGNVLSTTMSAAFSIANSVVNFGIGFIFAIYILLQKETLGRQMKRLLNAFLPEAVNRKVLEVAVLSEKTFSNFLAGQCLEAVILGTMFFVVLSILRMPYALLIGVLIAFTALIPIFGAFIGCAVGAFLMLMVNPVMALTFVAVFFVLQQVEGNLIYPHVVGNSVGLPSIWVLVAVTVGGSTFGIVGMLVFIPLCSIFYTLLRQEVNARLGYRQTGGKPDGQVEKQTGKQSGKRAGKQSGKKAGKQVEKQSGKPDEKQSGKPDEKQIGKPDEKQLGKQVEKQSGKPDEKQIGKPDEKQVGKPAEKQSGKSVEKQSGKPAEKPSGKQTEKQSEKQMEKPSGKQPEKTSGKQPERQPEKQVEKPSGKQPEKLSGKSSEKQTGKLPEKLPEKQYGNPMEK